MTGRHDSSVVAGPFLSEEGYHGPFRSLMERASFDASRRCMAKNEGWRWGMAEYDPVTRKDRDKPFAERLYL